MGKRGTLTLTALILLSLYVGSYLALVEPRIGFVGGLGPWPYTPTYRIGGDAAKTIYHPIQQLDEKVRPDFWRFDMTD